MSRNAAIALAGALAFLLFCPGLLAAKPTRTLSRPASPRFLASGSARRGSHQREARATTSKRNDAHTARQRQERGNRATAANGRRSKGGRAEAAEVRGTKRRGARVQVVRDASDSPATARNARRVHTRERRHYEAATQPEPEVADTSRGIARPDTEAAADATETATALTHVIAPMKSVEEEAATPLLIPAVKVTSLYDSRGRLMVPAPLYGSHEILLHQNEMADRDGLDRIRNDQNLEELLKQKKLVALPASEMLEVDDRLPENRRYSRPWTAAFLAVLSRDYYASFHQPLYVTSAVRTVEVQQHLERVNGNAAPSSGETASPHLTGQAVDIAKKGLTMTQIAWLRTYLQPLIGEQKIDVEEEFRQACFHISVYKNFLPAVSRMTVAAERQPAESRP
jgi:hypothetical protein